MRTTTLILGAGFGGLSTARTLRNLLPEEDRILLVDRSTTFHVGAGKNWVMLGEAEPAEISRPIEKMIPAGVEFLNTEVRQIDPERIEVHTADGTLQGDHLVIALGAELNMDAVPGLSSTPTFYSLDGAIALREVLRVFDGGELVILIVGKPFKCPPAPYEAAMLLHEHFGERGIRKQVHLNIYTFEGAPMSTAGPEMGALMREQLSHRDIGFHPSRPPARIDPARRIVTFENGTEVSYELLMAVPPHRAPSAVRECALANEAGWIPVDPRTLKPAAAGDMPVYAIGDVTMVPLPGRYKPDVPLALPKAGVMAAAHGRVVAERIASRVRGEAASAVFDGEGFCFIETGRREAMRGGGSFFSLPHPQVEKRAPDVQQHREKLAWVEEWLKPMGER